MTQTFVVGQASPAPLSAPTEAEIVARWSGLRSTAPLVSILCPTYQQAPYVRDAMNGFLAQATPFPFEVIVHDDGSTDGTAEIVAEYTERYPRIVRAILNPRNSWAEAHPLVRLMPEARGQFIALCEGDDYWIDPNKLAIQVRDLERQEGAVVSHHDSIGVAGDRVIWPGRGPSHLRDHDPESLRRGDLTKMVSLCFRNVVPDMEESGKHIRVMFDRLLGCMLAEHGGSILSVDLLPAVYRVHEAGVWSGLGPRQRAEVISSERYWIAMHFARAGRSDMAIHHLFAAMAPLIPPAAGTGGASDVVATNLRTFLSHFSTRQLLRVVVERVTSRLVALLPGGAGLSGRRRTAGSYTRPRKTAPTGPPPESITQE